MKITFLPKPARALVAAALAAVTAGLPAAAQTAEGEGTLPLPFSAPATFGLFPSELT